MSSCRNYKNKKEAFEQMIFLQQVGGDSPPKGSIRMGMRLGH